MANLTAFYETKMMFVENLQFDHQLSYEEWCNAPDDHKAALLFVNFYAKMVQAWDKANRFDFIPGEDGVSTVLQYLQKNVAKLIEEPAKYSEAYIYKVAYNCMYCICHDLKSVQDRWDNETSSTVVHDGEEISLYDDKRYATASAEDVLLLETEQKAFWELVENSDAKTQKVIDYLLASDPKVLKKLSKRSKQYSVDPLRDVEVSLQEAEEIIEQIKEKLDVQDLLEQIREKIASFETEYSYQAI